MTTHNSGFTLIEALIYSALLSMLMVGVLGSTYLMIQGVDSSNERYSIDEEANFILKKIDWALNGVTNINLPASGLSGSVLSVTKTGFGSPVIFQLNGENMEIDPGVGSYSQLNSGNVSVSNLVFDHIPPSGSKPAAVKLSFNVDDRFFQALKYIR